MPPNTSLEKCLYDLTLDKWDRFDATAKVTLRQVFADEEGEPIHWVCRLFCHEDLTFEHKHLNMYSVGMI